MTTRTTRRLAAAMAAAALLAIAGFTALGSVFEYPQILKSPTADILDLYRRHQGAVTIWFLVLMVSAALLAPAGILLGRPGRRQPRTMDRRPGRGRRRRPGHRPLPLGRPGAGHQPRRARPGQDRRRPPQLRARPHLARHRPRRDHRLRPHRGLHRAHHPGRHPGHHPPVDDLPRVRVGRPHRHRRRHPLGLEAATLTNFAGYVAWCLWLLAMAVFLWRARPAIPSSPTAAMAGSS